MTNAGPYATAANTYWAAGWRGILPLPPKRKNDPPKGFTGANGGWPSYPDIHAWGEGREGAGNIGLRMPPNVIGIDVDDYGDKIGGQTLRLAEAAHGELPPTWRSTSRDDGVSGIRFYRVPEGLAWPGEIGPSIEVIQTRHRYAVAHPSLHPEGGTYRWINPQGIVSTIVPDPDDFPSLPESWVGAYTGGEMAVDTPRVDIKHAEAVGWIASRDHATASMCTRMERALEQHADDLGGSAHNSTRDATLRVARLADEGHHGAVLALAEVRSRFLADATSPNRSLLGTKMRTQSEAVYEFGELVASAVGVVLGKPSGLTTCDCYGQLTGLIAPPAETPRATAIDGTAALDPHPAAQPEAAEPDPADDSPARFKDGATFILDAPDTLPNVWGDGDESLWAEGEALMICGPPGVGKTTLTGQVVRGLLGLQDSVLGLSVRPASDRVLYLAMDRPAQIARGLRRAFHERERDILREGLRFWEGPPPGDVAKHPTVLLSMAQLAEADVIIIDSVKDAAVGLSEDEVAAAYNRARQNCLANGVQVLELHHMVKRGAGGNKPKELADVYGSAWLTAGAGSVLLLWGAAGDPIVEMIHLKQPGGEVGPWRLIHDHGAGTTSIFHQTDILGTIAAAGALGVTATTIAEHLYDTEKPTETQKQKARNQLNKLVSQGHAERREEARDAWAGGKSQARYFSAGNPTKPQPNPFVNPVQPHQPNPTKNDPDLSVNPNQEPNQANQTAGPTKTAPPSLEGERVRAPDSDPSKTPSTLDCNGCGRPFAAKAIEQGHGYCFNCAKVRRS